MSVLGGAPEYLCLCRRSSRVSLSLAAELLFIFASDGTAAEQLNASVCARGAPEYLCLCRQRSRIFSLPAELQSTFVSGGNAVARVELAQPQVL